MEELEIPQGVQIAVESRLTKLPGDHQETLRMAAILGREFDYEILLAALDLDEDVLIEALEAAEEAQMIQEADGAGEVSFVFVHALVPSAIVESVRTLRRRRLHKRAAAAIEDLTPQDFEALAYHYGKAGDEEGALKYHVLAGERAAAAFANQDAEEHFLAALDLVEGEREEADLLVQIGIAQTNQGKFKGSIETWRRAIGYYQILGDKDKAAEIYARSGLAAWYDGDTKGGLDICHQGLSTAEGAPDGPGLARLLAETGRACYFNGIHEDCEKYSQEALLMAERLNLSSVQIESLISLGMLTERTAEQSVKLLKNAIELAETNNLPQQAIRAHNNLAVQYTVTLVDYPKAAQHYQRAAEIAHQVGDGEMGLFIRVNLAFNKLNEGQLNSVAEMLPTLQDLMESLPDSGAGGRNLKSLKSGLLTYRGNLDQALEILQERIVEDHEVGDLQGLISANWYIARISMITRDFELGKTAAEELIELGKVGGGSKSIGHSLLSRIYSRNGEINKAAQPLEEAYREAEVSQTEYLDHLYLLWAQADLYVAQKNWEEALKTFPDLIELITGKGLRWHRSQALVDWAEAHLARAEPEDKDKAINILREAHSEFQDMGADGFVQRVAEQLENIK
jgi:tetratricopeptide (TPR) repeat protein